MTYSEYFDNMFTMLENACIEYDYESTFEGTMYEGAGDAVTSKLADLGRFIQKVIVKVWMAISKFFGDIARRIAAKFADKEINLSLKEDIDVPAGILKQDKQVFTSIQKVFIRIAKGSSMGVFEAGLEAELDTISKRLDKLMVVQKVSAGKSLKISKAAIMKYCDYISLTAEAIAEQAKSAKVGARTEADKYRPGGTRSTATDKFDKDKYKTASNRETFVKDKISEVSKKATEFANVCNAFVAEIIDRQITGGETADYTSGKGEKITKKIDRAVDTAKSNVNAAKDAAVNKVKGVFNKKDVMNQSIDFESMSAEDMNRYRASLLVEAADILKDSAAQKDVEDLPDETPVKTDDYDPEVNGGKVMPEVYHTDHLEDIKDLVDGDSEAVKILTDDEGGKAITESVEFEF